MNYQSLVETMKTLEAALQSIWNEEQTITPAYQMVRSAKHHVSKMANVELRGE